ncbi:MAG: Fe-S protein assembly co-chaperone HscB [Gammaproteobacteria bacterium]|nr:Fe-S protein assembly co-chaperone HscB [Gammaproteobacteria bacterium]
MQSGDLTSDYFKLFALPVSFDIDDKVLAERYRELQRAVHPDRFVNASDAERRLSMQLATRVNEGFRTLKDPLARARYLLEFKGVVLDDTDTRLDSGFLMQQIELRERMGAVKGATDAGQRLHELRDAIRTLERQLVDELASLFAAGSPQALQQARDASRKLQFFHRLGEELAQQEDELAMS